MNEQEIRERTTPPAQSATSPYTGEARENAVKGMKCCRWGMCFACPYNDGVHGNTGCKVKLIDDVISLLEALDVTPEELERLKKCRHECKIDCLLEHYEKIKAERDALLKAQEPRVMTLEEALGSDECWLERKGGSVTVADIALNGQDSGGYDVDSNELSTMRSYIFHSGYYGKYWRCWTSRPTDEQREAVPWQG